MDDEAVLKRQLGRGLKLAREAAGMTQRQLAEVAGIPQGKISHYEHGQYMAPLEKVFAVDRACGQPQGYVLRLAGLVEETDDIVSRLRADPRLTAEMREAIVHIYELGTNGRVEDPTATVTAELASASRRAPARRRRQGPARSA